MTSFEPADSVPGEAPAGATPEPNAQADRFAPLQTPDLKLLEALRTRGHDDPTLVERVSMFSRTGEHGAAWLALGTAGILLSRSPARRIAWADGVSAVAFSVAANFVVKSLVQRPRPTLDGLPPLTPVVTELSFPSAHTTAAFTGARMYSRALPIATPLFYATAGAYAYSRPYLGVHYPSDVLAGALLGTAIGRLWPSSPLPKRKQSKASKAKPVKVSKRAQRRASKPAKRKTAKRA